MNTQIAKRRPWVAGALSTILPGLGHIYCGLFPHAMAFMLASAFCFAAALAATCHGAFAQSTGFFILAGILLALNLPLYLWALTDATKQARATRADYRLKEYNRIWIYAGLVLLASGGSIAGTLTFREFAYHPFYVPVSSMSPTIESGDGVFVRKSLYTHENPESGEVVIFRNPEDRNIFFVKRVVALAGDRVAIKDGMLLINGKAVATELQGSPERFSETLNERSYTVMTSSKIKDFEEIIVPPHHCFVLGDNRANSYDSRYFGPVAYASLTGRAEFTYWSKNPDKRFSIIR